MDSRPNAALPILRLDDDVFHHLAEQLQYELSLRAFSRTCKDVRQRCMPVLFRACVAQPLTNIKSYFLPEVLWPHVRSLTFIDPCAMISAPNRLPQWSDEPPPHTVQVGVGGEDPLLCRIYDETTLRAALMSASMAHGLPWSVLEVVVSVPHLRGFTCERYFISTRPFSSGLHGLSLAGHAPLECFLYVSWDYRQPPRDFPAEKEALDFVLNALNESLRTLELPTRPSTIDTLASLTWPSLRTLTLRGDPPRLDSAPAGSEPQTSYISALSTMPKLRGLELSFSYPREPSARASLTSVWPPQCIATYPWPDLERLTLSYPRADDRLYTHLPATLRSLSLRYVPHLVTAAWAADTDQYRPPWQEPPLLARGLLDILRRCGTPMLEALEVEYHRTERDPEAEDLAIPCGAKEGGGRGVHRASRGSSRPTPHRLLASGPAGDAVEAVLWSAWRVVQLQRRESAPPKDAPSVLCCLPRMGRVPPRPTRQRSRVRKWLVRHGASRVRS
ncbi:hypothetical protein BV20DRAFT_974376 [Pilatotrama ljubarskyi]|nr:hypothetical protein BV20DRAFT_974376 [Pilatotrama ljubarskyi]